MNNILKIAFILLIVSCEEKQSKTIPGKENKSITVKEKKISQDVKKATVDSTKAPKPSVIIPVKIPKTEDKIINCFPPKSIECKDKGGDMENGFATECIYANHDLSEAYKVFRERNKDKDDGKFLENKMPIAKYIANFKEYPISVTYTYPKHNILEVEILFPGGVTIINFKKETNDVKVNINHSPD